MEVTMEIRKKVETEKVEMLCDECKEGTMNATGQTLLSYPAQYMHKCTNCGKQKSYKRIYPRYEHIEPKG